MMLHSTIVLLREVNMDFLSQGVEPGLRNKDR